MRKSTAASQEFRKNTDLANNSLKKFGREETAASQGARKFKTDNDKAGNSMKKAARDAETFGQRLGGLKSMFTAVATSAVLLTAKKWFIDGNAEMESYRMTLTAIYGGNKKMANDMLKWGEKFAASTPFEIPQIIEATTRLQSYGLNAKKSLGIIGDMASVMGKDLMSAVEAVADAQTGELERMKEFGITKRMIAEQAKLMKVSVTNSKGQITDQKAFNAVMFALMEKRFKGGMKLQSQTFNGMMSNVMDFVGRIGRTLGGPIFAAASTGIQNMLGKFDQFEKSGKLKKLLKDLQAFGKAVWDGLKPMIDAFVFVGGILFKIGGFITMLAGRSKLVRILITSFTFLSTVLGVAAVIFGIVTAAQWALNSAMLANPLFWVIAAIVALVAVGVLVAKNWKQISAWLMGVWTSIKQAVVNVWNAIVNWIKQAAINIWNFIKTWGPWIIAALIGPFALAALAIYKNWDKIKKFVVQAIQWAYNAGTKVIKTMARGITSAGKWLWNAVKNVFTKVRKLLPFSDAKEGPFSDLTLSGRRFMTTFSDGVNQGKGSLNTAVDSAFSRIKQTKLSYGVSATGTGVNPAGYGQRPAQIVQHIKIDRLIETLQLHDVGDRDIDKLVNELVTKLYEKLKRAGETKAAGAGMGAIL
jgi:hypothetical protein